MVIVIAAQLQIVDFGTRETGCTGGVLNIESLYTFYALPKSSEKAAPIGVMMKLIAFSSFAAKQTRAKKNRLRPQIPQQSFHGFSLAPM